MTLKNIPTDSILTHWVRYLSMSEIPTNYQIACGLTALGSLLRRNRYIDQIEFKVWPCQSVLLIGPSGIGKDTIINRVVRVMDVTGGVPVMGGTTYEGIAARLAQLGKPACAYIPAHELTAFFGRSEYQQTMLAGMTNILSCGDKVDITTKGAIFRDGNFTGHPVYIYQPTVTMHGGSTVEWLHKQMPEGTLEGGFLGRFLIMCEEFGSKHVPLVKTDKTQAEIKALWNQLDSWMAGVKTIVDECRKPAEVHLLPEAEEIYGNWYHNRFRLFSRAVLPYANRSRDMVLRIALLMAISRGHYRWIEGVDMDFAIALIQEVAQRIDKVVIPPARGAAIAAKIMDMLPCPERTIYAALGDRYQTRDIFEALDLLRRSGRAWFNSRTERMEVIESTTT
ncbi:MAG: DUF3987 domain-containing protein [Thaumarchaeota archaeon]|nr:DUF3987 domain-containing protein [Nitrososphaerota archaeon]